MNRSEAVVVVHNQFSDHKMLLKALNLKVLNDKVLNQRTAGGEAKKPDVTKSVRKVTYAAVAPKISTLLAVVKRARQIEKMAENTRMTPSLSTMLVT